jgi:sialic acid synthase
MRSLTIADRKITQDGFCFVIAEIGHNHGGNLDIALQMCKAAKDCGCDAVKFQKRTIDRCFTKAYLATPYNSEHAFGPTYGEHRYALEFGFGEYTEIARFCKKIGIFFLATAFDEDAADFLEDIDVPAYKIASGDLTNLPLIEYIAKKGKPMIISTGGADIVDILRVHNRLWDNQAAFLHCVARYPCKAEDCNLRAIENMMSRLPGRIIGYSSHFNGPLSGRDAYYYGARIIEQHFTLDRTSKGSDHAMSLEPAGMKELVDDLLLARIMAGTGIKVPTQAESKALEKMGKVIWPARTLSTGHVLTDKDLAIKSPIVQGAIAPYKAKDIIGKVLINSVSTSAPLTEDDLLMEDDDEESI